MKSANRERNKTLCSVLQSAVIDLCREKYFVDSADWEVDGIICISVPESREQHVVKIHEKFPLESLRKLADVNDICYACEKQREKYAEEGHPHDRDNSFQNSEEEERYRDVSVIDLEHALQTDNVVDTGQSHQIQHEAESVRGDKFRSKNHTEQEGYFLQGQYVNETSHQGSSRNAEVYGSRNDRHSVKSSGEPFAEPFSNIPNEPLPPPPVDIGDEADYTIIKNEPSESEDFDLHMQCINEDYDVNVQKASVVDKRDLAADSESFLAASEHKQSPALKQFDNSARAWSQRKHPPPSSTVSSAASQPLVSTGEPFPSGAASSAFGQPVSVKGNNVTLIKSDMNNTNINISPSALGSQPSSSSQQKGIGKMKPKQSAVSHSSVTIKNMAALRAARSRAAAPIARQIIQHNMQMSQNKGDGVKTGARYKCNVCGKEFTQQQHFLGHVNVHYGLRPFKCTQCSKGFPYQSQLAAHRKICTGEVNKGNTGKTPCTRMRNFTPAQGRQLFKCKCGAEFNVQSTYLFHRTTCSVAQNAS